MDMLTEPHKHNLQVEGRHEENGLENKMSKRRGEQSMSEPAKASRQSDRLSKKKSESVPEQKSEPEPEQSMSEPAMELEQSEGLSRKKAEPKLPGGKDLIHQTAAFKAACAFDEVPLAGDSKKPNEGTGSDEEFEADLVANVLVPGKLRRHVNDKCYLTFEPDKASDKAFAIGRLSVHKRFATADVISTKEVVLKICSVVDEEPEEDQTSEEDLALFKIKRSRQFSEFLDSLSMLQLELLMKQQHAQGKTLFVTPKQTKHMNMFDSINSSESQVARSKDSDPAKQGLSSVGASSTSKQPQNNVLASQALLEFCNVFDDIKGITKEVVQPKLSEVLKLLVKDAKLRSELLLSEAIGMVGFQEFLGEVTIEVPGKPTKKVKYGIEYTLRRVLSEVCVEALRETFKVVKFDKPKKALELFRNQRAERVLQTALPSWKNNDECLHYFFVSAPDRLFCQRADHEIPNPVCLPARVARAVAGLTPEASRAWLKAEQLVLEETAVNAIVDYGCGFLNPLGLTDEEVAGWPPMWEGAGQGVLKGLEAPSTAAGFRFVILKLILWMLIAPEEKIGVSETFERRAITLNKQLDDTGNASAEDVAVFFAKKELSAYSYLVTHILLHTLPRKFLNGSHCATMTKSFWMYRVLLAVKEHLASWKLLGFTAQRDGQVSGTELDLTSQETGIDASSVFDQTEDDRIDGL